MNTTGSADSIHTKNEPQDATYTGNVGASDWWLRIVANTNRRAVDEDYRKKIAKGLS